MDPDLLRLILVLLGITLVIGIYLWDRFKRSRATPRFAHYKEEADSSATQETKPAPHFGDESWDMPEVSDDKSPTLKDHEEESEQVLPDIIEKMVAHRDDDKDENKDSDGPLELNEWDQIDGKEEPQFTLDLSFNAQGDSDHITLDPDLYAEVPRKIIQINILAREENFSGELLFKAAKEVEMEFGDMEIFHRTDGQFGDQVLFSMANLVEPGTFPADAKKRKTFESPGITLFTQLPTVRDGLAVYSDMLFTAERLAALLNAELQDSNRSALTKQAIEHTRESILEHKRQIQLIRSRRKK